MGQAGNPVNWFEIPVVDLDRAVHFYQTVLGYELSRNDLGPIHMAFFPMLDNARGTSGALVQSDGFIPAATGILIYFTVDDIDATLQRVEAEGGLILQRRESIGKYGWVGRFEDSEGNVVALHSFT